MVCVLAKGGKPLMPTNIKRARKLLRSGRAQIAGHRPFTIRLLEREDGETQPIEYCCDTGDRHIGISIKSDKQEFVSAQYDLLTDEPKMHRDRTVHRRARRGRLRHRKARFNNRRIPKGWMPPTLRNKSDQHVLLFKRYKRVLPITSVVVEMGSFDPQALAAVEAGKPLPEGADYQRGERYGYATLREAVFTRDHYTCQVCEKSIKDGAILRVHHIGFQKKDRSNRLTNLLTVCTACHTPKNHKPGGKLWDLEPEQGSLASAAHMNAFRWDLWNKLKEAAGEDIDMRMTWGAATKLSRRALNLPKSHVNDAYAMGELHPKKRARTERWQKCRRNNRVLEKFYDARYVDLRDGKTKSGAQLSCGRTRRRESRHGKSSERVFRARRADKRLKNGSISVQKGHRNIRRQRYPYRPGDTIWTNTGKHVVKGVHNGNNIEFADGKSCAPSKVKRHVFTDGWRNAL